MSFSFSFFERKKRGAAEWGRKAGADVSSFFCELLLSAVPEWEESCFSSFFFFRVFFLSNLEERKTCLLLLLSFERFPFPSKGASNDNKSQLTSLMLATALISKRDKEKKNKRSFSPVKPPLHPSPPFLPPRPPPRAPRAPPSSPQREAPKTEPRWGHHLLGQQPEPRAGPGRATAAGRRRR